MLLLLFIQVIQGSALRSDNNACSRLYDYPVMDKSRNCYVNPNVMALTPSMIKQNGYPVLSYNVTTSDGYILQIFRIPPNKGDNRTNKQPVMLEHGLFHDSSLWTFVGNRSLAFNLADRGYDVWLANQRGSRYSRTHTKFNTSSFEYWNYSLDDMAANDIPALLKLISNVTGRAGSIIYIGHSRGSTLMFMYASENPVVQQLLKCIVALSPIAYFDAIWYIRRLAVMAPSIAKRLLRSKIPAVFYNIDYVSQFSYSFCSHYPYVCRLLIDVTSGVTWQFLPDDLLAFYTHTLSTESLKELIHFAQLIVTGKFQKYDFGQLENLMEYGQENPPQYNLTNIKIPVFIYYGENDVFITEKSVLKVFDELGSDEKAFWKIPMTIEEETYQFSHNDFIWAKYIDAFLYTNLFLVLDSQRINF